jgi:GNAT superfamily N-acetyltransferase
MLKLADARCRQGAPVYLAWFGWESPLFDGRHRAFHCIDIAFWLMNTDRMVTHCGGGNRPYRLSMKMSEALVNFMKTGVPSAKHLPQWEPYTPETGNTMILNDKSYMTYDIDKEARKKAFLDARRSVRSGEALIEYYKNEIEQAVGGGMLNGFVAHSLNEIVAYCNCWDKKVYDRLPVSDESHNIPEGEKVFAIVEILIAKNFEHCGVEAKMVSNALEWAKKNGYTLAEAYVVERKIFEEDADKFKETCALYENLGFSLTRSLTENGQRKFVMQKDLK